MNITQRAMQNVEEVWLDSLSKINERLYEAKNPEEYLAALHNEISADQSDTMGQLKENMEGAKEFYYDVLRTREDLNSIGYSLRRFIYEQSTGRNRGQKMVDFNVPAMDEKYSIDMINPEEPEQIFEVHIKTNALHFKEITFVIPNKTDDLEYTDFQMEVEKYATLLYKLTLANGACRINKNGRIEGIISKQEYKNYLNNKGISREKLFYMSLALKFTPEIMKDFANAVGISPVYNFRCVDDCIFYYCHSVRPVYPYITFMDMKRKYQKMCGNEEEKETCSMHSSMTQIIQMDIDDILQQTYEDENTAKDAFINYLVRRNADFVGYSKNAWEALREELTNPHLIDYDGFEQIICRPLRETSVHENESGVKYSRMKGNETIGNMILEALICPEADELYIEVENNKAIDDSCKKELEDKDRKEWKSELSKRRKKLPMWLRESMMSGERMEGLMRKEFPVTKRDILQVRFYKLVTGISFVDMSNDQHFEILKKFKRTTDLLLASIGLPYIYAADPFDNLLLAALCTPDPLDFFSSVVKRFIEQ